MITLDDIPDIRQLNWTAEECVAHNNPTQAMLCWERSLFLHQHYLGFESTEVWALAHRMCTFAIESAGSFLNSNRLDDARKFLAKADALITQDDYKLRTTLYNLFATYYRRVGKLRVAYTYLQRAMKIDQVHELDTLQAAETRLNACAILSQLGRHEKALQTSQKALILLQERAIANENKLDVSHWGAQAVAYYNMAVEEEFLNKPIAQTLQSYRRAAQIAKDHCESDLAEALSQAFHAAEAMSTQKKNHAVFSKARESKAMHHVKAQPKRPSIPKRTIQAYGVDTTPTPVQDILSPKGTGVDMSQFDDKALADSFELPIPQHQPIDSSPKDQLLSLMTPRSDSKEDVDTCIVNEEMNSEDKVSLNEDTMEMIDNEDEPKSSSIDADKENRFDDSKPELYDDDNLDKGTTENDFKNSIVDEDNEYKDPPIDSKDIDSEEK